MQLPCSRGCKDRKPACQDRCRKPEYLEAKRMQELERKDRNDRAEQRNYDRNAFYRHCKK